MRMLATFMLVAMAILFIAATRLQPLHPAWGFVRAFAEAAMVGGLADWFAVTALFRHPLGLPIPHTAIIPRNKDRIGETLASFLRDNFLIPSVVARRMRNVDIAGAIGRFLANPPPEGRLREGASRLFAGLLESLDEERLGGMVKAAVAARLKTLDVSPLLGKTLEAAINEERHVPMLDSIVTWAGRTLDANEDIIRAMVHQKAGWIVRLAGLDERLADAIVDGLRRLTIDMAVDPQHPLRAKAEEGLAGLAWDMQWDAETQEKVEAWKAEILANKAVTEWVGGLWENSRAALLKAARDPDAVLAGKFGEALRQLGESVQQDPRLKGAINSFARRAVVGVVATYGSGIVTLVSDTVRGWDARTITGRLENAVGRDLQYIRINGTLVGGLVGLLIHTIEVLA
ncbi:DUF445 domain-containing protein [Allosphingosinicella deserti]|uniref:DUF445 domain-containing protein n=1 Tax=Allosphingosinicella deserti TaxID=2116704 RepID=A0A2P7QIJ9_9SPHN|nr:DUF445 domain-containing protein [Sphingomonas deserti]PSJ37770.1 DUF445 domain-containing protein [Sphingomonas deserti]